MQPDRPAETPDLASGVAGQRRAALDRPIVVRSEVADRYEAGNAGLSPRQIVIRSEVADRYAN